MGRISIRLHDSSTGVAIPRPVPAELKLSSGQKPARPFFWRDLGPALFFTDQILVVFHHPLNIFLSFANWRNPLATLNTGGTSVIGRQGQGQLSVEGVQEIAQIFRSPHYVFPGIIGIADLQQLKIFRHDLHETNGTLGRNRIGVKI